MTFRAALITHAAIWLAGVFHTRRILPKGSTPNPSGTQPPTGPKIWEVINPQTRYHGRMAGGRGNRRSQNRSVAAKRHYINLMAVILFLFVYIFQYRSDRKTVRLQHSLGP
jgi:hypothetical protein